MPAQPVAVAATSAQALWRCITGVVAILVSVADSTCCITCQFVQLGRLHESFVEDDKRNFLPL